MRCNTLLSSAILLSTTQTTNARTWTSIEIPEIDANIETDPLLRSASQLAMEDMSFLLGMSAEDNIKSSYAGGETFSTPTVGDQPSYSLFSIAPSSQPSTSIELVAPNFDTTENVPTWSPSTRYQAVNGNCKDDESLHRLVMYDSNRDDAMGSSLLMIQDETSNVIFESNSDSVDEDANSTETNSTPKSKTSYLCLKNPMCYSMNYNDATIDASWELHQMILGTGVGTILVAKGTSDESGCQIGLGDDSCATSCHGVFKDGHLREDATNPPTTKPTWKPSRQPTTPIPSIYLPQDKKVSFGSERYSRLLSIVLAASPNSKAALSDDDSPQHAALVWLYNSADDTLSNEQTVLRWILASFYYGLNGDNWLRKKGWLSTNNSECDWFGISCVDGLISQISLEENRMVGEIVPEIVLFKDSLSHLSLGNNYDTPEKEWNKIVMPLPSFLGDLSILTYLNLEGVGLTSNIPSTLFSQWSQLESLYMNSNDITGTLPHSIASLKSIKVLWMGGNNLDGSIISEIGQLTTLVDLSLESNFREDTAGKRGFVSALPASLAQLTKLEILDVSDNALSGTIPPQLGDLISLRSLDLSNNFFEKQLPTALGRLQMLEELDISFNWLSSTIPKEYGDMISLTSLSLASNYKDQNGYFTWGIHGMLPTEIGKLKNLKHLHLNDNYLSGSLMTEIGQLHFLETLHLQSNSFLGPIPFEYSNCVALEEILLEENNLGTVGMPEQICRLPELEMARVDCQVSCSCCSGC